LNCSKSILDIATLINSCLEYPPFLHTSLMLWTIACGRFSIMVSVNYVYYWFSI